MVSIAVESDSEHAQYLLNNVVNMSSIFFVQTDVESLCSSLDFHLRGGTPAETEPGILPLCEKLGEAVVHVLRVLDVRYDK